MTSRSFLSRFDSAQPIIAMAHVPPLPGTPLHDDRAGMSGLVAAVRADLDALLVPGSTQSCSATRVIDHIASAPPEGIAALARVVTELAPSDRPFGVDYLWDPLAALAIAHATGAAFIREVVTGVYESDRLWAPDAGSFSESAVVSGRMTSPSS